MSVHLEIRRLAVCLQAQTCGSCQGSGHTTVRETSGGIYREYTQPCTACRGTGQR